MTKVTDDYQRADTSTLTGYTELVGNWEVVSNKLQCNDDGGATGYYLRHDTDTGSTNGYVQAVVSSTQVNASSNTGVLFRGQTGATNTSYQFVTNHQANTWALWRVVAGSETLIASGSTPIAPGDTIRLEVTGNILRAKVNGTLVALARDANVTTGSRGGLNGYNAVNSDVVEIDNFETGAITDSPMAAAYMEDWAVFGEGTITPRTPAIPPSLAAGDLIWAWGTVRDAAQTITMPAGQGWVQIEAPSQTGLESALFAKIWGLGGQTDASSPSVSVGSAADGFGITVGVIRNPRHSTDPWTSVAAAIVASGSQSNASSNTVTAPSVTYTGPHVTVVRFFSSADDNNLGAPSPGLQVVGGTAYHTASGLDFAQAASIVEDTTVSGSTGTATVTEASGGPDVSNGVTIVVAIPPVNLVAQDAAQAQSAGAPALTQVHNLTAAAAAQGHAAAAPALTQVHSLVADSAAQAHAAGNAILTTATGLVAQDAAQAQAATSPALTQLHVLAAADAGQAQSSGSPALTQAHSLSAADAAQAHAADTPALTQAHELDPANAAQTQAAGSPALTQVHNLTATGAVQAQAATNATITEIGPFDLVPADAIQAQAAGNATLTQTHLLAVADAAQGHTAGTVQLAQVHHLAAAGAVHTHTADQPPLTVVGALPDPGILSLAAIDDNYPLTALPERP